MQKILNWAGTALGIIGTALVAFQLYKSGYICWLIGNTMFIYTGLQEKTFYKVTLFGAYQLFSIIGFIKVI